MTREEAVEILERSGDYVGLLPSEFWSNDEGICEAIDMAIEALQTEVVRCKDCKWAEKAILDEYCVECTMYHTPCARHGYCHHGERQSRCMDALDG